MSGEGVKLSEKEFAEECKGIVDKARSNNVTLRVLGALAVYVHSAHSEDSLSLYDSIKRLGENRSTFTDIDLVGYSSEGKEIDTFFERTLGFKPDVMLKMLYGKRRSIYYHPDNSYFVDVFFDKLEFSHDVEFGSKPRNGRLEYDYPTITLADIVLEKTQIHRINLKDLIDLAILFLGHDVETKQQSETIDGHYVATVLSRDWGFWRDGTNNLGNLKHYVTQLLSEQRLVKSQHDVITRRADRLLEVIEEMPKTREWQKRAKVGTTKPWYREVEEVVR
jgi:hypothetical protein